MDVLVSVVMFVVALCPSLPRLAWLWVQRRAGQVFDPDDFASGVLLHVLNVLASFGGVGYLVYAAKQCGPGCGSGLSLLLLAPLVWVVFFWANRYLTPIETGGEQGRRNDEAPS